jgi:transposase
MRKPRKNDSPSEKVAILWRHLIDRVPLSDFCDEYQLSPTLFYAWQKIFLDNGASAFERKNAPPIYSRSAKCVAFPLRKSPSLRTREVV